MQQGSARPVYIHSTQMHWHTDTDPTSPSVVPSTPLLHAIPPFSSWFLGCNTLHEERKQPTQLWLRAHAKSFELLGFRILLCYFIVFAVMAPRMTTGLMGCGISLCAAGIHIICQAASIIHQNQSQQLKRNFNERLIWTAAGYHTFRANHKQEFVP